MTHQCVNLLLISIHTPTQGVTRDNGSRVPEMYISIHTPTQGVTICHCLVKIRICNFNPHSHAGSDIAQMPV